MQIPKIKIFDNSKIEFAKIPNILESYSFWIIIVIIVLIIGGEWGFFMYSKKKVSDAQKSPQAQSIVIDQVGIDLLQEFKNERKERYDAIDSKTIVNPFFSINQMPDSPTKGEGVKID